MDTFLERWHRTPLFVRILGGLMLGVVVGLLLGKRAIPFSVPCLLLMQLLTAVSSPLILLAVVQAIMQVELPKNSGWKLGGLLLLNTLVAIVIGLGVANTIRPGFWNKTLQDSVDDVVREKEREETKAKSNTFKDLFDNLPKSILGPLSDGGKTIAVIVMAIAFGLTLRGMKEHPIHNVMDVVEVCFRALIHILHWIIELIPFAVFGMVASSVGEKGFADMKALVAFIVAVLIALTLQITWYLVRIQFGCWASPLHVLRGMRDALVMAFSTASSTATMPVTYACLREKVGLKEQSASMGALVGANFNNDGTALYEAMAALFISQLIGSELTLLQQVQVIGLSIFASVGAAGIPNAGLVTMQLVLTSVGLSGAYAFLLTPVDWFLDRCRTAVNVLGDVNVSCMLEGHDREKVHIEPAAAELNELTGGSPISPPEKN